MLGYIVRRYSDDPIIGIVIMIVGIIPVLMLAKRARLDLAICSVMYILGSILISCLVVGLGLTPVFMAKSPVIASIIVFLMYKSTTGGDLGEEIAKDHQEQEDAAKERVEALRQELDSEWTVIRAYMGAQQEFLFKQDLDSLQKAGIRTFVRTAGVTNIYVPNESVDAAEDALTN